MSDENPPQDVAALLSRTQLDKYKVFTQDRRSGGSDNYTGVERRSGGNAFPLSRTGGAPANPTTESAKLEFVRPQPPQWSLLQNLGSESESPALRGDSSELSVPTFAICSPGGGTGKTTVSATLGRALSAAGENVLMVHGAQQSSAPLHFGAQFSQSCRLRTFVPPLRSQGTVHIVSHEFDAAPKNDEDSGAWLIGEVNSLQNEIDRCIVEISVPRGSEGPMLNLAFACVVVITPDINSVMALAPFRKLFERVNRTGARQQMGVHFLINKFDPESAFHAQVRQNLRLQLGPRLLPFCIRRSDAVAEALAAGMTVLDYAPNSAPADDFQRLAVWVREATSARRSHGAV